jgi:hypothetical protein
MLILGIIQNPTIKLNDYIPKIRNETNGNGKQIGLKHGNKIFEHGTIKKWNKKNTF